MNLHARRKSVKETDLIGQRNSAGGDWTLWCRGYQRRTQKGTGRTEKTVLRGAAKNPRCLKACNITVRSDMGEFFFIFLPDEISGKFFTMQRTSIFQSKSDLNVNFV